MFRKRGSHCKFWGEEVKEMWRGTVRTLSGSCRQLGVSKSILGLSRLIPGRGHEELAEHPLLPSAACCRPGYLLADLAPAGYGQRGRLRRGLFSASSCWLLLASAWGGSTMPGQLHQGCQAWSLPEVLSIHAVLHC